MPGGNLKYAASRPGGEVRRVQTFKFERISRDVGNAHRLLVKLNHAIGYREYHDITIRHTVSR